jgi:hypothetical protein
MKSFVILIFSLVLASHTAFANLADVSFFTRRGERFQVVLNGRLINRYAATQINLPALPGGYHVAEIRLPDRFGTLVHRMRIFVEPGFRTDYVIGVVGRRPKVVVSKARQYPLPTTPRPVPGPYAPRPGYDSGSDNDYYRGRDRYQDEGHDGYNRDRYQHQEQDDYYQERDRYQDQDHVREVMPAAEVDRLVQAMAARPFGDDKLSLARQVLSQQTFYAADLKRVLNSFTFDDHKLTLAKALYANVYDQRNLYVVYDAFRFASDRRELERYIASLPVH